MLNALQETKKKDLIHLKYQGRLSKEKIFNLRLAVVQVRGSGRHRIQQVQRPLVGRLPEGHAWDGKEGQQS